MDLGSAPEIASTQAASIQRRLRSMAKDKKPSSDASVEANVEDPADNAGRLEFVVVGIGASAGGLEALEGFFRGVRIGSKMAYVVIQHLSPDHKSLMAEILGRQTKLPVRPALDGEAPQPDSVYLISPRQELETAGGRFRVTELRGGRHTHFPIDRFFLSLARQQGERSAAVVLSGTGSDGAKGLRAVKEAGGMVLVQRPETARFDGMPRSALETGFADRVLSPEEMGAELQKLGRLEDLPEPTRALEETEGAAQAYRDLVSSLQVHAQFDISGYREATVLRRVQRRMIVHDVGSFEDYVKFAMNDRGELQALLQDLFVGVTQFFRDPEVYAAVYSKAILPTVTAHDSSEPLRVWVTSCSTGEEAYSLGILFREAMEETKRTVDVRIFATDVDRRSLEIAARGVFPASIAADVSRERLARQFERRGDDLAVTRPLRQMIVFAPHNILRDPPFHQLHLVSCRNILIYLRKEPQAQVLSRLHSALKPGGYLLLGKSESIGDLGAQFRPIDLKRRLYCAQGRRRTWNDGYSVRPEGPPASKVLAEGATARGDLIGSIGRELIDRYAPLAFLVDGAFSLIHVFGDARAYLRVPPGRVRMTLLDLVAPPVQAILTFALQKCLRSDKELVYRHVRIGHGTDGSMAHVKLRRVSGEGALVLVVLEVLESEDSVESPDPQMGDGERSRDLELRVREMHEELQRSKESQQALIEELETSNEELQATNEELLSSNEELQSTNEELRAVNEELQTANQEREQRITWLTELNADLDNLLRSTNVGTLFLDEELRIRKFTPAASEFIHILDRDVGRPVEHLVTRFDRESFTGDLRKVLSNGVRMERTVRVGEDEHALMRAQPYVDAAGVVTGVVVTFIDVAEFQRALDRVRSILDGIPEQVAKLDARGVIQVVNKAWERFAAENGGDPRAVAAGVSYLDICSRSGEDGAEVHLRLKALLDGKEASFVHEYPCHSSTETRWFLMHASRVSDGGIVVNHMNITERKRAEIALREQATKDPLTGILNRRGLQEHLRLEILRGARSSSGVFAAVLDCDDFKKINETFGYAWGDQVLREIAHRIGRSTRPSDHVGRAGGDEFVAILPETRASEAMLVAERIRDAVRESPIQLEGGSVIVTISLAVVEVTRDVASVEDLLARASSALRDSKERGKNTTTAAGHVTPLPDMLHDPQSLGLRAVAQPIVALRDEAPVGFEVFIRGPKGPTEGPSDLFRSVRERGQLNSLDVACLRRAHELAASEIPSHLWLHVNLFPSTLLEPTLEDVLHCLSNMARPVVRVEPSERQMHGDPRALLAPVKEVRARGAQIVIDHVGFGRSSLETIVILEPEGAKLDGELVRGVARDPGRRRTLQRVVSIVQSAGSVVLASSVENRADLAVLKDLGVEFGQGYLWGDPEGATTAADVVG